MNNMHQAAEQKWKTIAAIQRKTTTQRFYFYCIDICDEKALQALFKKHAPDTICHFAALAGVSPSVQNPVPYINNNIVGTVHLLEAARPCVQQIIFASSSSVYGESGTLPCDEDTVSDRPISPYAATKKSAELFLYAYHHLYNISCTCLRFFTVYGPGGRSDMAPSIFLSSLMNEQPIFLHGDGEGMRDFTYIDDIVDGVLKAIAHPLPFATINIGSGAPVTLNEFIAMLERITKKKAQIVYMPFPKENVLKTHADIAKAKRMLHYCPQTSLFEGLEKMYDWYVRYQYVS